MAGKSDVVESVANSTGASKKDAAEAFDAIFESISDHLVQGERVQIPGFGSFSISERAARQGRNPATGEKIRIAASKNVRFKAGKDLKESVNR